MMKRAIDHPYPNDSIPYMWMCKLANKEAMDQLLQDSQPLFALRRSIEDYLSRSLPDDAIGHMYAKCCVCNTVTALRYDHQYERPGQVNWRERLVCEECGLNNRLRLCIALLERHIPESMADVFRIYATEHMTPLGTILGKRYRALSRSEYFGPHAKKGEFDEKGIMNQDVTDLTFPDRQFDIVLSFDVLEHVPDYVAALREFHRVLDNSGKLLISVPFVLNSQETIVRARLTPDGTIEHLLEPEYHGDPIKPDGGVLCFYHFGWSLLDDLRDAGFSDAQLSLHWSLGYGHIGPEQIIISATKR